MRGPRTPIACSVFLVALIAPSIARAGEGEREPGCTVRLDRTQGTAEPSDAWDRAREAVEQFTHETPGDCASIEIRTDHEGATVDLVTSDGRRARRHIDRSRDLAPLVKALLTVYPDVAEAPAVTAAHTDTTEAPVPAPAPREAADADAVEPTPPHSTTELFASLGAGLKVPLGDVASPMGQISAGVAVASWEITGFGRWELEHHQSEHETYGRTTLGALGGGAALGRRQALGPTVLTFGATFGVYATEQEQSGRRPAGSSRADDSFVDPRAGLYVGCLIPASAHLRTRAQVGGELAMIDHDGEQGRFPDVHPWSLGLTIGVDFGMAR
jgi:hypothetical protein